VEKGETMMTVFLGLTVALLWGGADTVAMIATRRVGSSTTTFVAQLVGFLLLAVFGLAFAGRLGLWPDTLSVLSVSVLWGIGLGGVSALAYLTLYKSLSHGLLAVVSPVISAQGGVTLILAIVLLQEHLEGFQMLFLLLTFVGVILASMNVRELVKMRLKSLLGPGVRYALVSLLCFGALSFGVGLAARQSNWLISVFFIRCFSFLFLTAILRSQSPEKRAKQSRALGYFLAGIVGCADMAGLTLLSLATATGSIGIAGMICSDYAVIPLLAGVFLLKERLTLSQFLGCVLLGMGLAGEAAPGLVLELSLAELSLMVVVGCGLALLREIIIAKPRLTQFCGVSERES
jgi:drug/metabolite transporter (DMT)-like permease